MEGEFWNQSDLNSTQLPCGGPNSTQGARGGGPCPSAGVDPSMVTAIVIMALYSIVCVVGLFGNFLVMYVIISLKPKRKVREASKSDLENTRESVESQWGRTVSK
uniref:Uncharacterized protein n=1 Tax=Sphaerodactylus townsendi TaxID=933632 RepID=A0ACB8GBY9_9SAUR